MRLLSQFTINIGEPKLAEIYSLTLLLVLLPPSDDATVPPSTDPITFQALKDTAHLLELWDRSGPWAADYRSEVAWCQTAFRRTWGSPSLGDIHRLPSLTQIESALALNEAHQCWLLDAAAARLYARPYYDSLLTDTRLRHAAWTAMRIARSPYDLHNLSMRRCALRDLRDAVGPADYFASCWPAAIPAP